MNVISKISLDLVQKDSTPIVPVKQGDAYSREIEISLFHQGVPCTVSGAAAIVRYSKADGTCGTYDTLPNGDAAVTIVDNILICKPAPQMLTASGPVLCDITLIQNEAVISTFDFIIAVEPSPAQDAPLESQDFYQVASFAQVNAALQQQNAAMVKSVNYIQPDREGNVNIPLSSPGNGGAGYYMPSVSMDGVLSWTPSSTGMPAINPVNIKGNPGADGTDGIDGANGTDGISPTVSVTEVAGGHQITVTDAGGAHSFNVLDAGLSGGVPYGKELTESWADLRTRIQAGDFTGIRIGDYKVITLTTGETAVMEVAGIDQYYRCGDDANIIGHHVDFISRDCLSGGKTYNGTDTNNGTSAEQNPWLASSLYQTMNITVLAALPADLKACIIQKRACLENRYSSAGAVNANTGLAWKNMGLLWLPTEAEVFANTFQSGNKWTGGGGCNKQYPIFTGNAYHLIKGNGSGGARRGWWLASAVDQSTTAFCCVNADGIAGCTDATGTVMRAPLCFRIG